MSQEEKNMLFPSLSQLLGFSQKNWESELSCEQFFALILAYNDKISGKKRESEKNAFGNKVYTLSKDEKAALMLAYKSGRNANHTEKDVIKKFAEICNNEVAGVLESNLSRTEILQSLHNLAVEKLSQNPSIKPNQFSFYSKITALTEKVSASVAKENFKFNCQTLDRLAEIENDESAFAKFTANKTPKEKEKIKENIPTGCEICLQNLYTHVLKSVESVIGFDAYQHIFAPAEAG